MPPVVLCILDGWGLSEDKYREISSCSSCATFQGQRMKTRYKNENKETHFVGTLNGSGPVGFEIINKSIRIFTN